MFEATIAVVTRDRRDELRRALTSAVTQEGSIEILVIDDGSRDGTARMLAEEFPGVRLARFEESAGLVVRRNEAARLARGPIIVSIDDDAVFISSATVAQTVRDFDDPRIGAVAIPYLDVPRSSQEHQRAPEPSRQWIAATFRGTAYAVRREVFLALGGFRELIVHQGEEPDFSLRLLSAGYVVRLGRADGIHHFESTHRDLRRMARYGRRNELLLAFTYFPIPFNALLMLAYAMKGLRLGVRLGIVGEMAHGIAFGLRSCWRLRNERQPLPVRVIVLERRLRRWGALPLDRIESHLGRLPRH